jgi:tripartite-type tricarboxylate transporter receptor subunit TctC
MCIAPYHLHAILLGDTMKALFKIAAIALAAGAAVGAHAQDYPAAGKTITLIVPFTAGGPTDKVARDLAATGKL